MKVGHYHNEPVAQASPVLPHELGTFLKRKILVEKDLSDKVNAQAVVNLCTFDISFNGYLFPIAVNTGVTGPGDYILVEKWQNPYWKKNGKAYLPGDDNPIGTRLMVLSNQEGRKMPFSIHEWPKPPYETHGFRQGSYGKGCIRMRLPDLLDFFQEIPLGASISLKK